MPRRKGQGILPTKRLQNNKDGSVQSRKKPTDSYEDAGDGMARLLQPQVDESHPELGVPAEVNNSKYLHKKFKKVATSSPTQVLQTTAQKTEDQLSARPLEVIINGLVKAQKEAIGCELKACDVSMPRETLSDLSAISGKVNSASKLKGVESVSLPGPVVVLPSQGRYICPYCKLACAKPSVLQKHIRAHTNERPYPCVPCGFAFKTKSNLYKHCRSRAHALKMEEHGSKFSYSLDEPSDMEDEDDENNSNNTSPSPSGFLGAIHGVTATVTVAASQLSTSPTLPSAAQSGIVDNAEKRSIYKPKFHKAAMYHEEEDAIQINKKGTNLSLKIPMPNMPSHANVGSILSKTPSSPSSEFLQRHISKIISENQAIVETMDLWPKKHSRQKDKEGGPHSPLSLSASTSPSLDPASFPNKLFQRQMSSSESTDERIKAHHAAQSKLALALLRPNLADSPKTMECLPDQSLYSQQPLNLTTHHVKEDSVFLHRKRSLSEGLGNIQPKQGTVIKDQSTLNNKTLISKGRTDDIGLLFDGLQKNADKFFHSQNPEGSIIKDLLLKARAAAGLSIQGLQDVAYSEVAANTPPHLLVQEDFQGHQNTQYICQLCNIPYRNAENLEIHQLYYCKGDGLKQTSSPQHSPNSKYGSSMRELHEESSPSKGKTQSTKGKAKLDLKISPVKDGVKICQPFPSPGPLLGSTPLVESYYYKNQDEDCGRPQKKPRLDSENSSRSSPNSLQEVRSISSPFAAMSTGGTTTLRSLEELSKCPMRPNSLQMFGGEVSILDGAGETKTMRIEPRGKSPSASEYLSLPNVHQSGVITKSEGLDSSPHVVTIARSGLNSGGTIVQVPLKANAALSLVKPPRSSGGSVNSRSAPSPITLSPLHRTPRQSLSSPPNTPFSTSTYLSHNTSTLSTSYPDTPKLMPNITTPNLAVPGIPAPTMTHHMPYMPFTSILPDGTLMNPLINITAFNPLTLPPHSALLHANLLNLSAKDHNLSETPYPGGVVTILHGGKVIPYVQGMPGPQTLMANSPNLGARKSLSPKPLDLASPSKEQFPLLKIDSLQNTNQQQKHFSKNKFAKCSTSTSAATVIQSSHRKAPQKELPSPRAVTLKQAPKPPITIPSIKVDTISPSSDSSTGSEEMKRPMQSPRKCLKKTEHVVSAGVKESVRNVDDESMEEDVDTAKSGQSRGKFLRPTSLPLKPGTFVPKQHHGLTPLGGVLSLVSPETPRPKKSYGQLYLNGHSYTYLALKCSTRPFHCTLNRPQPMYVLQTPEHATLSMYSNWKVCSEADPHPLGLDPGKAMAFYDSRLHRVSAYTVAKASEKLPMTLTHSSYWVNKQLCPKSNATAAGNHTRDEGAQSEEREGTIEGIQNLSLGDLPPKRVKIFDGGFESNEDYIYIRGRGRGRYVCEECGIRCKKPSMLKKHIRTHTDVRPFTCKHCTFSFKTKGNLTKHMKSKAHYKKCVELGIVPVPTVVDDSYIDEECLAIQQALRASRHGNDDTDSDENDEEEEEEDDEDDDDDDGGDDEGRLEREAACSLLSLAESTRFSSSTNHRYLSLGLIPLPSIIARPTTYPYVLTFAVPKANQQVTEPHTPTLVNLTAQTENEKVSRNTGLALELREDTIGKALSMLNRNNNSALIPPTGEKNRCYFPSRRTPTLVKSLSEKSWSDDDSDGFEYDNSDGLSDESDMSDGDEKIDGGKSRRYEKDAAKMKDSDRDSAHCKELYDSKNIAKNLRNILPAAHMKSLRELRESYEQSVGIKTRDESMDVDSEEKNSSGPMDLSSKSMSLTRKLSLSLPYYANGTNGARTPTTPISEILTPVSEPAVLASLCSSMERFPVPQTLPAKLAIDIKETTMLQAYLTEKALQDVRVKQHQHRHNQGYTVSLSAIKVKEGWMRPPQPEAKQLVQENLKNSQVNTDILISILQVPKELSKMDIKSKIQVEGIWREEKTTNEMDVKNADHMKGSCVEPSRNVIVKTPEPVTVCQDIPVNLNEIESKVEKDSDSSEMPVSKSGDVSSGGDSVVEKVPTSTADTVKVRDGMKMHGNEKLACVSMANNIVRNVVVGGSAFRSSSPPSSGNEKKSPSPGKPKAEFMPPSSGPSSSYCSLLEDGRSICVICNKIFSKPSQLRLHVNIHYFERPFRCESCAVSFRTKGHLQKHERSVSHQNKVSMNSTFGAATTTNPRPFKCDDCKIAFRIHGHLAKHLRSKMHIMKLECVGKLPFGTYAEMEREGVSLNDIDTSDCDNSLESLQMLAQKLYEKDPSKLGQWDGERGVLLNPDPLLSGGESSSDEGEPCVSPPPQHSDLYAQEINLKTLSLRNVHSKSDTPPPSNTRVIAYAESQHKLMPYQLAEHSQGEEGPRMLNEREHRASMESTSSKFNNTEYSPRVDANRKRKSVDELDYTDTSDGDNEASSNLKYWCGICQQEFSTIALLHVHSFVEHDPSSTEEDKIPAGFRSKVPTLSSVLQKPLRKSSVIYDDSGSRITNMTDSLKQMCKDTVIEFTTNEVSNVVPADNERLLQSSPQLNKKLVSCNFPIDSVQSVEKSSNMDTDSSGNYDTNQAALDIKQSNTRGGALENNLQKQ